MTDDLVGRLRRLGAMPADETARGFIGSYVAATSEAAARIEALEAALERCAVIVERNLYRQHEKIEDVPKIARAAIGKDHPHAD